MQSGDGLGHLFHDMPVEGALPGQAVEEGVFVEARHLDQPVNGRAGAIQPQGAVGARVTGITPRYMAGAVRRFMDTSASQAARRISGVEKSR